MLQENPHHILALTACPHKLFKDAGESEPHCLLIILQHFLQKDFKTSCHLIKSHSYCLPRNVLITFTDDFLIITGFSALNIITQHTHHGTEKLFPRGRGAGGQESHPTLLLCTTGRTVALFFFYGKSYQNV